MSANAKTIKRRIRSVANTRKITKAMELVAASKMRRAVNSVLAARPYAKLAWDTVRTIAKAAPDEVSHPLLNTNEEADKSLILLFTSDRGLAGAFNANIIKKTLAEIESLSGDVDIVSIGRRGAAAVQRKKLSVVAGFEGLTNKPKFKDILPIANLVLKEFTNGTYKRVLLAFTDFHSALSQTPNIIQLLPLTAPEEHESFGATKKAPEEQDEMNISRAHEYTFEPSPREVLDKALPGIVETMVYRALLESAASEHSARMMAMRNATDSAGDMLVELKFTYNRIRQANITQEIAEISSGKAALE